ncbi:putative iron-only hydrogenase system regulator [Anaerotaenia torta]
MGRCCPKATAAAQESASRLFIQKYPNWEEIGMETRIALIGIIVEDMDAVERLNGLLHEYGQYIIGRMGIPYREKNINIISVVVNADSDTISTLAGKLGMIKGVNVKTVYSKK